MGANHGTGEAFRYRQPHDIGRIGAADEDKTPIEGWCGVIRVSAAGGEPLPLQGAKQKICQRQMGFQELVDGEDGCHRAGGTAAQTAGERQALMQLQSDAAVWLEPVEQGLHGPTGRVEAGIQRQTSTVAGNLSQYDSRLFGSSGDDFVPRTLQGKAEDVEAAGDVGHSGGGKGTHDLLRAHAVAPERASTSSSNPLATANSAARRAPPAAPRMVL